MDFYFSTENDPLEKFLFPNEVSALRGNNVFDENMGNLMRSNIYFNKYIGGGSILSWGNEDYAEQDSQPRLPQCKSEGGI